MFIPRRTFLTTALAGLLAPPALAQERAYVLGPKGATITYIFQLNSAPVRGTVPVTRIDMAIDPGNLGRARVDVTADIRRAKTGLIFATQALKSASVLNADQFPEARFRSTGITLGAAGRLSQGATVQGELTLRGKTTTIRLDANVFRPRGAAPADFSRLLVRLNGQLDRSRFGATGYPDLVKDSVGLEIEADIRVA